MANLCSFELVVKGTKESVDTFTDILTSSPDGSGDRFFYGICDAAISVVFDENRNIINKEGYTDSKNKNSYCRVFCGACKWSIKTSLTEDGYYRDGDNSKAVCLETISKELNLTIEAFSEECGIGFMEHYIYHNGECLIEDVEDYASLCFEELSDEPTDEELLEFIECNEDIFDEYEVEDVTPDKIREMMANSNEGYYTFGGMEWNFIII